MRTCGHGKIVATVQILRQGVISPRPDGICESCRLWWSRWQVSNPLLTVKIRRLPIPFPEQDDPLQWLLERANHAKEARNA